MKRQINIEQQKKINLPVRKICSTSIRLSIFGPMQAPVQVLFADGLDILGVGAVVKVLLTEQSPWELFSHVVLLVDVRLPEIRVLNTIHIFDPWSWQRLLNGSNMFDVFRVWWTYGHCNPWGCWPGDWKPVLRYRIGVWRKTLRLAITAIVIIIIIIIIRTFIIIILLFFTLVI